MRLLSRKLSRIIKKRLRKLKLVRKQKSDTISLKLLDKSFKIVYNFKFHG
jgi:hypothetical protein